jgi:hypothetical protein
MENNWAIMHRTDLETFWQNHFILSEASTLLIL